jgi:phosphoribosylamine-glycine ligase
VARFAIVSGDSSGLSWWKRLHDEGHEILVYIVPGGKNGKDPMGSTHIGDGLVPKTENLSRLLEWAKQSKTIAFFDSASTRPGKVAGTIAQRFTDASIPVVGAGLFCERLEEDRLFGERLAQSIGCPIPETKSFSTISDTLAFAKEQGDDDAWYFKTDTYKESDATQGCKNGEQLVAYLTYVKKHFGDRIPNLLQRNIPGIALSTACWFNGLDFVPPFEGTIEHKKFMDGEIGPSLGCAINAVWFYDDDTPKIAKDLGWEHLSGLFRKQKAPAGLYDINAVISETDGRPYFLEWTPRCGWDSEAISQRLFESDLGLFLEGLATGKLAELPVSTRELAYGVRVSIPPYPWEHDENGKPNSIGVPVLGPDGIWDGNFIGYALRQGENGLEVADRSGLVGVVMATGRSLKKAHREVMDYARDQLWVKGLQYRTDGDKAMAKDAESITALGYPVPKGLTA